MFLFPTNLNGEMFIMNFNWLCVNVRIYVFSYIYFYYLSVSYANTTCAVCSVASLNLKQHSVYIFL